MQKLMVPLATLALFGCSSGSTRTIAGQLDLTQMRPVNAQVIARSSTGHAYVAPIGADGSFRITLPTHATYSMRFANATSTAKLYDAFATLAARRPAGNTHWFTLTPGATISLGRVARAGAASPAAKGPLTTASDSSENGAQDSGEQGENEDDGAAACDLAAGKDEADVESDHDVNDDVSSNKDGVADSKESDDSRATCSSKNDDGDKCALDDGEKQELDADADKMCQGGGSDGSTMPQPVAGLR